MHISNENQMANYDTWLKCGESDGSSSWLRIALLLLVRRRLFGQFLDKKISVPGKYKNPNYKKI